MNFSVYCVLLFNWLLYCKTQSKLLYHFLFFIIYFSFLLSWIQYLPFSIFSSVSSILVSFYLFSNLIHNQQVLVYTYVIYSFVSFTSCCYLQADHSLPFDLCAVISLKPRLVLPFTTLYVCHYCFYVVFVVKSYSTIRRSSYLFTAESWLHLLMFHLIYIVYFPNLPFPPYSINFLSEVSFLPPSLLRWSTNFSLPFSHFGITSPFLRDWVIGSTGDVNGVGGEGRVERLGR